MSIFCTAEFILEVICIWFIKEVSLTPVEPQSSLGTIPFPELKNPVFNPLPAANLPVISFPSSSIIPSQVAESVIQNQPPVAGWSTLTSKEVPDLVESFALQFIQGIQSDQNLKQAFEIRRLTADEATNIYYDIFYKLHSNIHSTAPDFSAQMVSEAVKLNFDYVTTESLIKIYAYSVGKHMFFQGLMTPENVLELSQTYLQNMKDNIYSAISSSPEADIRIITKGLIDFLTNIGYYKQNNADIVVAHFTNEWYNLRN